MTEYKVGKIVTVAKGSKIYTDNEHKLLGKDYYRCAMSKEVKIAAIFTESTTGIVHFMWRWRGDGHSYWQPMPGQPEESLYENGK